jgi:S-(hydroxymethyl)glutathione dehydrogenase/alcohol dehydrogenase
MNTRAAILHEPGAPFRVEACDLEPPREGEVLVEVKAAGVCHSDWHLATGATAHPLPVAAGHEGAGIVEAVGPGVRRVRPGDRVILNWAPSCGACFYCLEDRPGLCAAYTAPIWAGTMLDGTTRLWLGGKPVHHFSGLACFAERTVVPEVSCVRIDIDVPFPAAALIGCAVTTGVGAVLHTAGLRPGQGAAVYGAGGVGLGIILGARLAGAHPIIAVDRSDAKLAFARSLGATDGILAGPEALPRIRAATAGRGADRVFDATGIPAVQEECLAAARPGGMVVLAGIAPMKSSTNLPGAVITREEKTVAGCYYGRSNPARDFPFIAGLRAAGLLDIDRLVTRTYPLDRINEAYADLLGSEPGRGVIVL